MRSQFNRLLTQLLFGSLWKLALSKPQLFPAATITHRTLYWIGQMMGAPGWPTATLLHLGSSHILGVCILGELNP